MERGLVQVYTGKGKGKTTAALGLAMRAIGHGFKVKVIQFMKGSFYAGELLTAQRLYPELEILQFGWGCPLSALIRSGHGHCRKCGECFKRNRDPEQNFCLEALTYTRQIVIKGRYNLVILDEISHPLRHNLLQVSEVLDLINAKPPWVELILTGRDMAEELIAAADLVTEMQDIKHPLKSGIDSRRGIEY